MDKLAPYAKAIVGAVVGGLSVIATSLDDGGLTAQEWVYALIAFFGGLAAVYTIPEPAIVIDPRTMTTGELIRVAMSQFRAERRQRFIHANGRGMHTHGPGENVIWLPNGDHVKVAVDDSGIATQIEEPEHLHAIVRPEPIRAKFGVIHPSAAVSSHARPRPIKTSVIARRNT